MDAHCIGLVDQVLEEGLVGSLVVGPINSGALDVEPHHSEVDVIVSKVVDGRLDLSGRVSAAKAGEDVNIDVGDSGSSCGSNGSDNIAVDDASAFVSSVVFWNLRWRRKKDLFDVCNLLVDKLLLFV